MDEQEEQAFQRLRDLSTRPTTPRSAEWTPYARRQIRMQEDWDKQRAAEIEEQRTLQSMDIQQKQLQLEASQENRLFNEQQARMNAERLKAKMDEKNAAVKNVAFGIMADADLNDPSSYSRVVEQISGVAGALEDGDVRSALEVIQQASESSMGSIARKQQQELDDEFAADMQNLMGTGVAETELPQFFDPNSPIGRPQFDKRKVAAKLGGAKAQEREEAKTNEEENPKDEIALDFQQASGELNSLLLNGTGDPVAAGAKVAGLRARYKAATGEDIPEVPLQPKSKKEYDRIPAGRPYIGQDGKRRIKQ